MSSFIFTIGEHISTHESSVQSVRSLLLYHFFKKIAFGFRSRSLQRKYRGARFILCAPSRTYLALLKRYRVLPLHLEPFLFRAPSQSISFSFPFFSQNTLTFFLSFFLSFYLSIYLSIYLSFYFIMLLLQFYFCSFLSYRSGRSTTTKV